jgi:hypothetical protein
MVLAFNNLVTGSVVNDYGLDSIPYTVGTTGLTTALVAYIGWDVAQQPYQSSGHAPAVNVTDSTGNLWRQIGISTLSTASRGALWIADNPQQVSWVSVALTGWANSTSYIIGELDGIPSSMQAVALDFVKTVNSTAFTTSLSISGSASTTDIMFGLVTTGGAGGALTVPTGWTGLTAVTSGIPSGSSTYALWIPGTTGTMPVFNPSWANSVPSAGIVVGLKETSTAPTQTNPNMPNVTIEAAFGATPGDFTQSVDYTWSVEGLTWTDISSRGFGKGDDSNITIKRGRQYELSQEETGEIEITLDNHDGVFTFGNTLSPYYPNVIPGTPIRVTAWWQGVQYPIAFGYVERWPYDWPELPQWGFVTVTAVDAYGPLANTSLPSAVIGEIRQAFPYSYFTTAEQYEFTSQSLTPTESPIDANGLIAINYAFGNNRYAAYRDGYDQPVTTGQALNLLGDENTCLGATTYGGQEVEDNGPGMFYFDPNIPTNLGGQAFSVEFWFVWGNTNTYSCQLMSAFGRPSSFTASVPETTATNGGVLSVGVNTGLENAGTVLSGFYCNGVELTDQTFNQTTFAPQHFVLTTGPNGTTTYLNGQTTATFPTLGTIPQIRAICLGPARFSYDVSALVVYNGYNYIAGHFAWYDYAVTSQQVANHYEAGIAGWAGIVAPGRYAQALTWGNLGLKRGGTAWFGSHGTVEGTYISEAYQYDGSSAADVMNQLVQTEGGRCYTQGNGSIVYVYRWYQYNQPVSVVFGDNGTTEIPFEQDESFSVDNQFLFNVISATQNRGPNQDLSVQTTNYPSQLEYFQRSGLSYQSYALLPFDVFDAVNWATQKYAQPQLRVVTVEIDLSKVASKFPGAFTTVLGLELNQTVTVNRRPIGGQPFSVTGAVQSIGHDIGPTYWHTTLQIAPLFPENQTLFTDTSGQNSPNTSYLAW